MTNQAAEALKNKKNKLEAEINELERMVSLNTGKLAAFALAYTPPIFWPRICCPSICCLHLGMIHQCLIKLYLTLSSCRYMI